MTKFSDPLCSSPVHRDTQCHILIRVKLVLSSSLLFHNFLLNFVNRCSRGLHHRVRTAVAVGVKFLKVKCERVSVNLKPGFQNYNM